MPDRTYGIPEPQFHVDLRAFIKTPLPCWDCKEPKCACSGITYKRANVVFLPGERKWIEDQKMIVTNRLFKGDDPNQFPVSGDCNFLAGGKCSLGLTKPFDCLSFPFQPRLYNGKLIPGFAENCSFSPHKLPDSWVAELWEAWQFIERNTDPRWLEDYCNEPPHL